MKKIHLASALMTVVVMLSTVYAAMSDASALAKTKTIWGTRGTIGKQLTDAKWSMQVGYLDPQDVFRIVGQGISWEAAFAAIPPGYVAPAPHLLSATARNTSDGIAVQFLLDGRNLGAEDVSPPYSVILDTANLPLINEAPPVQIWICNPPSCFVPAVSRRLP